MEKIIINVVMCLLLLASITASATHEKPILHHLKGFWIYGFEKSLIETCDGKMYWMWTPYEFEGKYKAEGFRNPVKVVGYLLLPDPEKNMYSLLDQLKVVDIKHSSETC